MRMRRGSCGLSGRRLSGAGVPGPGARGDRWLGRPRLVWAASPWNVGGRPRDCPGVPRARIRSCRVRPPDLRSFVQRRREDGMERFVGLDVHRDFCEVAIVEQGRVRSAGRMATTPEALTLFGESLGPAAEVVLEATANALPIA